MCTNRCTLMIAFYRELRKWAVSDLLEDRSLHFGDLIFLERLDWQYRNLIRNNVPIYKVLLPVENQAHQIHKQEKTIVCDHNIWVDDVSATLSAPMPPRHDSHKNDCRVGHVNRCEQSHNYVVMFTSPFLFTSSDQYSQGTEANPVWYTQLNKQRG